MLHLELGYCRQGGQEHQLLAFSAVLGALSAGHQGSDGWKGLKAEKSWV